MAITGMFFSAFIVGLSGAMMPGPLLTYVISGSLRDGLRAGPMIILGHAILELLLLALLLFGLNDLLANQLFGAILGLVGGSVLLWMGTSMIKASWQKAISIEDKPAGEKSNSGLLITGAIVSLSNPYWVLWWATIGLSYLTQTSHNGLMMAGSFYLGHIMADLIWYSFVSWLVVFGRNLLNDRLYRILIIVFGLFLIYFAGTFIIGGINYFCSSTFFVFLL